MLRDLKAEGLIERIRVRGTFLREPAGDVPPRSVSLRVPEANLSSTQKQPSAQMEVLILAGLATINSDTPVSELWDYHAATASERAIQTVGHTTHTLNVSDADFDSVIGELNDCVAGGVGGIVIIGSIVAGKEQAQNIALLRRLLDLTDPSNRNPIPAVM